MHNTPEQNEAFRKAWDATNARYLAAWRYDVIAKHLATLGITEFKTHPANGCTMVSYGRVVAYYYVDGDTITDIIYD